MGRILTKVLIGSSLAFAVFLATIYLFGDKNDITLAWPDPFGSNGVLGTNESVNLTQTLSRKLADQLLEDNPEGPVISEDGSTLLTLGDPEGLIDQLLAEQDTEFAVEDFIPDIDGRKLNIIEESTTKTRTEYFIQFIDVLGGTIKTTLSEDTGDRGALLTKLISERETAIEKLYQLAVPRDLQDIHEEIIVTLGTQRNIYLTLKNYEADPLRALLAVKFSEEVTENLENLKQQIIDYLVTNGLNS